MDAAVSYSFSSRRALSAIRAPSDANNLAVSNPVPDDVPTISAFFLTSISTLGFMLPLPFVATQMQFLTQQLDPVKGGRPLLMSALVKLALLNSCHVRGVLLHFCTWEALFSWEGLLLT